MPIGSHLANPEGFCSEHSARGRNTQPNEILDRIEDLPKREGGDQGDRHKCPYCAYIRGFLDALEKVENEGNAALVAQLRRKI